MPEGTAEKEVAEKIDRLYDETGRKIEKGRFKEAIDDVFAAVRFSNKYFDLHQPWITRNTDLPDCKKTLYNCVQLAANLAVLLEPFLPVSSEKVRGWLEIGNCWEAKEVPSGRILPEIEILFKRIDKTAVEEEEEKLRDSLKREAGALAFSPGFPYTERGIQKK